MLTRVVRTNGGAAGRNPAVLWDMVGSIPTPPTVAAEAGKPLWSLTAE